MKPFFTSLFVLFALFSFTNPFNIDEVIGGMRSGNASQVARYFDNTVEISMPDKSNTYSKSQAEVMLKDFFSNNPVKGFEIIHKGENGGSQYCIGTLTTRSGSFRTTIYMKLKNDKQLLEEIRLENH